MFNVEHAGTSTDQKNCFKHGICSNIKVTCKVFTFPIKGNSIVQLKQFQLFN